MVRNVIRAEANSQALFRLLPGWVSAFAIISVLVPVTLPTLTLADSILVMIIVLAMSVLEENRWEVAGCPIRNPTC